MDYIHKCFTWLCHFGMYNLLFSIVNYIPFISIGGIVYIIMLSVIFFSSPESSFIQM